MENASSIPAGNLPVPTPGRPGLMARIFGPLWLRVFLGTLAMMMALIGAFYAEENWRGQRDWNAYRKAVEARGESLDLKSYVPKPVSDDQNFCATPFLKAFFQTNYTGLESTNDLWFRAELCNWTAVSTPASERDLGHRHLTDSDGLATGFLNAAKWPGEGLEVH